MQELEVAVPEVIFGGQGLKTLGDHSFESMSARFGIYVLFSVDFS